MKLSAKGFEALEAAIRVARDQQVKRVARLRSLLLDLGYKKSEIDEAIHYWSKYVREGIGESHEH